MSFSERVHAFDRRLLEAAKQIVGACNLTVRPRGMLDPKVLAYLLLCRTILNFEGMLFVGEEIASLSRRERWHAVA